MSDQDESQIEGEKPKRSRKKKKPPAEKMNFDNYARDNLSHLSQYEVAYYQPKYRGTMKTKEEWDAEFASLTK